MKKLLSLLSVLTITGTAVPTTIAASSYQKEEALNSEINSSQTNNLENLIRNKRSLDILKSKNDVIYYTFNKNTWNDIKFQAQKIHNEHHFDSHGNDNSWEVFSNYIKENIFEKTNITTLDSSVTGFFQANGYTREVHSLINVIFQNYTKIDEFIQINNNYNWFSLSTLSNSDNFVILSSRLPDSIDDSSFYNKLKKIIITAGCAAVGTFGGAAGATITAISCYYIS
ncbi:MAG: hypothetical protein OHM56_07795 [Spiroplasma phoeniceum]|nr:MAG: hypothetical protein OHM57_07195 [Spiroplasma phoeniceum]UZQ31536.1 MAG: hypothetical protein OHM56_07795 [Spiroplasma phoeniceum]